MKFYLTLITILLTSLTFSQEAMKETLPYKTIPKAPETYTAANVTARMIDGLGFRYYWATETLSNKDLNYKPSTEGRSIAETMEHIYNLSLTILNSAKKMPNDRTLKQEKPATGDLRKRTLENLEMASTLIKKSTDLSEHKIVFINAKGSSEFPFWNQINGPIEDAVWHAGQIVLMRRSAGNPFNSKVSVFTGNVRD
jgi:uncharacterized damage-inducible protein DinB